VRLEGRQIYRRPSGSAPPPPGRGKAVGTECMCEHQHVCMHETKHPLATVGLGGRGAAAHR
jgi:hypothetical protein